VPVTLTLNQAESLVAYLDLLDRSMKDRKNLLRQAFESEEGLLPRDWMRAVDAKASIKAAIKQVKGKAK